MGATPARLSTPEFFAKFLRVPDGGRLLSLQLHAAQLAALDAWDLLDPQTGLPVYDAHLWAWIKKAGKSATAGGLVLKELVDGIGEDREIIIVASDFEQSKNVTFASAVRYVRRHAWLTKRIRLLGHELIYGQTVTDPRTGGRHLQEHIVREVPARDARSLHGVNPVLVVVDEAWAQNDYGVLEALAPSPTRRVSRTLFCSYAGLRSQMREGNPLWDLWQRWKAATDPRLFVSYIGGPDGWRSIPWIKPSFIESQRRKFASVPSKYRRLWENQWASGDEGSFLSGEEIHAAIDPELSEPAHGLPGIAYTLGVDLGLTFDWSALVLTHISSDHKLTVDAVRFWRGTRSRPVSIMAVEDEIVALSKRFHIGRVVLDQWQAAQLSERLGQRGVRDVFTVAVDPSRLDRLATLLKRSFSARQIRIPRHPELLEQLETIISIEQKRRDLVRFTSGAGQDAGGHDDIVIALALAMEPQSHDIGRAALPATFNQCYRAASVRSFSPLQCFLVGGSEANYIPPGNSDPSCAACPGWIYARQAFRDYKDRGGENIDIRTWRRRFVIDNEFVGRAKQAQWEFWYV
jgi:hypothetical protein